MKTLSVLFAALICVQTFAAPSERREVSTSADFTVELGQVELSYPSFLENEISSQDGTCDQSDIRWCNTRCVDKQEEYNGGWILQEVICGDHGMNCSCRFSPAGPTPTQPCYYFCGGGRATTPAGIGY